MKVKVCVGTTRTIQINDNRFLDVSVYPGKWFTIVNMSLWDKSREVALSFEERKHINFNKFLPTGIAIKLGKYMLNRQTKKVAGVKVF